MKNTHLRIVGLLFFAFSMLGFPGNSVFAQGSNVRHPKEKDMQMDCKEVCKKRKKKCKKACYLESQQRLKAGADAAQEKNTTSECTQVCKTKVQKCKKRCKAFNKAVKKMIEKKGCAGCTKNRGGPKIVR